MQKNILLLTLFFFTVSLLQAQNDTSSIEFERELKIGVRIQKTQKLYWENGFALDYTCNQLLEKRVHFGLSYVTSRLGSAFNSNAIKQDNYLFSTAYHFRHTKALQVIGRLNLGYFHADMENEIFDVLPHNAFLISIDAGVYYQFKFPLTIALSAGYNINNGKGTSGPGTLFPVFYQMSLFYTVIKP